MASYFFFASLCTPWAPWNERIAPASLTVPLMMEVRVLFDEDTRSVSHHDGSQSFPIFGRDIIGVQ